MVSGASPAGPGFLGGQPQAAIMKQMLLDQRAQLLEQQKQQFLREQRQQQQQQILAEQVPRAVAPPTRPAPGGVGGGEVTARASVRMSTV